jgi:hypothetical protein
MAREPPAICGDDGRKTMDRKVRARHRRTDPRNTRSLTKLTYALIPGAGGSAWYWHLVEPERRERGHHVVARLTPGGR